MLAVAAVRLRYKAHVIAAVKALFRGNSSRKINKIIGIVQLAVFIGVNYQIRSFAFSDVRH